MSQNNFRFYHSGSGILLQDVSTWTEWRKPKALFSLRVSTPLLSLFWVVCQPLPICRPASSRSLLLANRKSYQAVHLYFPFILIHSIYLCLFFFFFSLVVCYFLIYLFILQNTIFFSLFLIFILWSCK